MTVLIGCCALVACGASQTGATGSRSPVGIVDACSLLTQAAAAQLTGDQSMTKIGGGATTASDTCVYADASSSGGSGATMTIQPVPGGISGQALQAALAQAMQNAGGTAQPVSGVGEEALEEAAGNSAGIVFVTAARLVVLGASSATRSGAALEPYLESLARQAAGRL